MNTGRVRLAKAIYGAFLPHLLPFSGRLILACASLIASIIVTLLEPWPLKFIFDQVLFGRPFPPKFTFVGAVLGNNSIRLLAGLCGSLVLIVLLKCVFAFLNRYWISAVGQAVTNNIRLALVDHLHGLSLASLASRRSGDVVYRLTGDIKALRDLLVGHAQNLGRHLLALAGTLAVMLWMDWKLTLVALAIMPPLYALSVHFSSGIRRAARNAKRKESDVASIVQETVTSLAVVQAFSQQDQERQRLVEESRESLRASLEGTRLGKAFGQVMTVVSACGMALAVFYGAT